MQRDLLFNIKKLKGPSSSFYPQKQIASNINLKCSVITQEDIKTTAKLIKNGLQFYTKTALGSCTSLEPCAGHLMLLHANCVGCMHIIVNEKKLQNAIKVCQEFGSILAEKMPNSIELKTNEMELKAMIEYQKKLQGDLDE